ncbi:hypothetical protein I9W82_001392 [Candida metapsilosis]|uniref:Uncharacterized protein n=1 Tax=Candida metapsilosis TaxID=273372 RepID=A0A8H7ZLT1_9ASCO|nr:hypothetical protein I9W82_001392 [Candida metapsilosis]
MASDWAAKLAQAAPTQPKSATQTPSQAKPDKTSKSTTRPTSRSSPPPPKGAQQTTTSASFNAQQVQQYLQSNYESYLTKARQDKEGEHYKIYRSLESSNQWETQVKSSARNVLRNQSQSNTIDILFEINRSVFQQRQGEKKQ